MLRWTGFFLLACAAWAQTAAPVSSTPKTGKLDLTVSAAMASPKPIAGASVTWVGPDNQPHTGVTGADGHLRVSDLAPGVYRIEIRAAGYTWPVRTAAVSPAYVPAGNVTVLYATMTPDRAIGGTIVDEDGKPIPGAIVVVRGITGPARPSRERSATTDAEGRYLIQDLTSMGIAGVWSVRAYVPAERVTELGKGFEPAYLENVALENTANSGLTENVDFRLRSTPLFHIRGRVVDKPDAAGAFVEIKECGQDAEDNAATHAAVGSDGSFDAVGLMPGAYCVALQAAQGSGYKYQSDLLVEVIHDRDLDQVELKARP